jgi:hypothetical protein
MCHHHEADWSTSRAADEEESEAEGRPPAFDDDRDVEVEVVTDGGDAA